MFRFDLKLPVSDLMDIDLCSVVYGSPPTFKEHLELFASHGIIVSPHGAGLMNAMFMPPFSSVIEIFPYHLHHNLYSTLSITSGLGYFPIYTYNGTDMWSRYKVQDL